LNGLQDVNFSACELTWKYFFLDEKIPEIVESIGIYDTFRHIGTKNEKKILETEYGLRTYISNYNDAYELLERNINDKNDMKFKIIKSDGYIIHQYLCKEANKTYKNGFPIYLNEPNVYLKDFESFQTVTRKFIAINKEKFIPVDFGIDYHSDGYDGVASFYYANGVWNFSLYNENGLVDCSEIAKKYGGGGHPGASGFITNNIYQFINNYI